MREPILSRRALLASAGVLFFLVAIFLLKSFSQIATDYGPDSTSPNLGDTIKWSIPQVDQTLFPGASSTVVVSFRSVKNLDDIYVDVTPSLSEYAVVSPDRLFKVVGNQSYVIALTLSAPSGFIKRDFGGVMRLRSGVSSRAYSQPLAIDLQTDFTTYSNSTLGFQLVMPINVVVTPVDSGAASSVYVHDALEEFPGGGITITKSSQPLTSIEAQIASTLTLTRSDTQIINNIVWTVNTYVDGFSNQQFVDAFTAVNGNVYQIGGLANPEVTNLLPALLAGFSFN